MADFVPMAKNANFYLFTIKWLICSVAEQMPFLLGLAPIKYRANKLDFS
jgi:hypothetical protein